MDAREHARALAPLCKVTAAMRPPSSAPLPLPPCTAERAPPRARACRYRHETFEQERLAERAAPKAAPKAASAAPKKRVSVVGGLLKGRSMSVSAPSGGTTTPAKAPKAGSKQAAKAGSKAPSKGKGKGGGVAKDGASLHQMFETHRAGGAAQLFRFKKSEWQMEEEEFETAMSLVAADDPLANEGDGAREGAKAGGADGGETKLLASLLLGAPDK